MNRIEKMLQELCPEGVEYKKLGEVSNITIGEFVHKNKQNLNGKYPVYNGGTSNTGFYDEFNNTKNKIIISARGANAGFVNRVFVNYWAGNSCYSIKINDPKELDWNYIYYYLKSNQTRLIGEQQTGSIPAVSKKQIYNIEIPVPPLPIQEKIVRILDHFTELTASLQAELQAELQARQEQYEYYRNKLLTFNILPPTTSTEVRWMKMSEICSVYTGGEMPKNSIISDVKTELYKYPIYANGKDVYGYSNSFRIKEDSVCISSIGANAGTVFFKNGYFTPIIRLKVIVPLTNTINTKYLYYAISTLRIKTKGNGGIPNINANDIKKLLVPIPSLSEQQRIVSILDKFETLVNDLSQGLPAEIAAVQEQYEYYRNKLLTFN